MIAAPPTATTFALRGDLLDFTADPGWAAPDAVPGVRWRPDHWLIVDAGRVVGAQPQAPTDGRALIDRRGSLVLPGFIDTHVHSPQVDVIASFGAQLLDWLETYTFPAEQRYADEAVAEAGAQLFTDALLAHGSTTAVVFPTVHAISADRLLSAAYDRGMRLIAGKVLMDRHAPEGLRDDVIGAERDSRALIGRWHGKGRLAYALTVRFAVTSSPQQMAMAGRLLQEVPDLYMQTHVAENRAEVEWVMQLHPEARSYLDVYHRAGLLNERAVLAHGIWLDDEDRALLRDTGAQISHCPTSNLFLGSGLIDWRALDAAGAKVSLGTDVGGGTSLSMVRTFGDAYKVQALRGERLTAWKALHAATLGGAQALGLDHEIGSFEPGRLADLTVWDWAVGAVAQRRDSLVRHPHERLFAWMTLGDERNLVETYVAGVARYVRGGSLGTDVAAGGLASGVGAASAAMARGRPPIAAEAAPTRTGTAGPDHQGRS